MIKPGMESKGRHKRRWVAALLVLVLLGAYCTWAVRRPLPDIAAVQPSATARAAVPGGKSLAWPAGGQAAVGIAGSGTLETHGKQTGEPTASTAKLITVLAVLRQKPLALGQQGPTITLTEHDVAIYKAYVAEQGSVVPVTVGEKITEYQMLEAILLPSANNIADSLAIWAFGSLKAYSTYANGYVAGLGLTSTHIGSDASGFNPDTVSSARDLVKLGEIAMQNPVLSRIVGQSTATGIPIAGTVRNVNFLLGTSGIVGVKTGNTDQAGGVFVGAADKQVNGKKIVLVTTVLGAHDLFAAMNSSLGLIRSVQENFKQTTIIKAGTIVGSYDMPWGGNVTATADQTMDMEGWAGSDIPFVVQLKPIPADAQTDRTVGSVAVKRSVLANAKSVPVKLTSSIPQPSVGWRLFHPFN